MHNPSPAHAATGVLLVLLAATLWGTTGTAQSLASDDLSALWFGALRLCIASLFMAAWATLAAAARDAPATPPGPLPRASVLGAGACMAVYNLAFFAGIRDTGVAVGTALALGSGPLWAGSLQALLLRQWPARRWWAGTAVAIAGGVLMSLAGGGAEASARAASVSGVALCLLSGLAYAGYTLIGKSQARQGRATQLTLPAFVLAAALALAAAAWEGGRPVLRGADGWLLAYVGVFTAGVAYLLYGIALRHVSAATAVTLALGEPVVAFVLAVVVLGEPATAAGLSGLLLIVGGVWVVVRAELRQPDAGAGPVAPRRRAGDTGA